VSLLLTAVAVRAQTADEVVDAMRDWCASHDVALTVEPGDSADSVHAYPPNANGWVVVLPHYVVPGDQLALGISAVGYICSSVSVYEDVYWTHVLCADGVVVDRFESFPDYFGTPDDPGPLLSRRPDLVAEIVQRQPFWRGRPDLVARMLQIDAAGLAPYFRQLSSAEHDADEEIYAFPEDEHDLFDGWVVTDLWRRMGIDYPDVDVDHRTVWLSPDHGERLPRLAV
jgi:hypothetical protein